MTLTAQELRHATYWGPFIKLMEEISDFEFWNNSGTFSANDRRRMIDVEFVSELAVAYLNGIQNKKKKLEEYYQQYEKSFDEAEGLREVFSNVLGEIGQLLPNLSKTRWRKKSDFYTLFLAFAANSDHLPLAAEKRAEAAAILLAFADQVDAVIRETVLEGLAIPENVLDYVKNVERAASDLAPRVERDRVVRNILKNVFTSESAT